MTLYEKSLDYAYTRYPWRVTVASESYQAGYKAATKEVRILLTDLLSELDSLSELSGMSYKSKLKEQVQQFLKEVLE